MPWTQFNADQDLPTPLRAGPAPRRGHTPYGVRSPRGWRPPSYQRSRSAVVQRTDPVGPPFPAAFWVCAKAGHVHRGWKEDENPLNKAFIAIGLARGRWEAIIPPVRL